VADGQSQARLIRRATETDGDPIWAILEPVIRAGETLALPRDLSRAAVLSLWLSEERETYLLEDDGKAAGVFYIRANQLGGGAHVANAGYATAADATGRGVARTMCAASFDIARERGFSAMQFNFVIASNAAAVHLWQKMGFAIVGRLPGAFAHPALGFVDALVMHRAL